MEGPLDNIEQDQATGECTCNQQMHASKWNTTSDILVFQVPLVTCILVLEILSLCQNTSHCPRWNGFITALVNVALTTWPWKMSRSSQNVPEWKLLGLDSLKTVILHHHFLAKNKKTWLASNTYQLSVFRLLLASQLARCFRTESHAVNLPATSAFVRISSSFSWDFLGFATRQQYEILAQCS